MSGKNEEGFILRTLEVAGTAEIANNIKDAATVAQSWAPGIFRGAARGLSKMAVGLQEMVIRFQHDESQDRCAELWS